MAIYHLNHRYVGKKSSAPGTAAAKVRYMVRSQACEKVVTVGLSTHPKALERAANENEHNSRANARVCDTFHIALPKEMSAEERIATTRHFLWQLTDGGRARAFAAFHGVDTHNPHIHVMFFDRDQDGKRVQSMSERGSTERMRVLWESACNSKLEEYGYDVRIDRRTLEAQLEEQKEELHAQPEQVGNPPLQELQQPEIEQSAPTEPALESPDVPVDEEAEELAPTPEEEPMVIQRDGYVQPHQRIQQALEHDHELRYLKHVQRLVQHHEAGMAHALAEQERLSGEARDHRTAAFTAEVEAWRTGEALGQYTKPGGRLKGFSFKVPFVDYEWKSPTRKTGERLQSEKANHEYRHTVETAAAADKDHAVAVEKNLEEENRRAYEVHKRDLDAQISAHGDKATLETAEKILSASIGAELTDLTPEAVYAEFENGNLNGGEALRALELMNAPEHYFEMVRERMGVESEMEAANDNEMEM